MSTEIKYNFDDPADYAFDANFIEVASSQANLRLAANAGQAFDQDFSSDSGFSYDSNRAEFQGGQVQQVNQIPDNATFGAVWNQNINGNWGSAASLIPTSTRNNPQISGGKLDLVYDKNIVYDFTGAINPNVGALKVKLTANWNGTPSVTQQIFHYLEPGGVKNRLYVELTNVGALRLYVFDENGVSSGFSSFGNWTTAVQGQDYEIEVNYDFTNGSEAQRIFIDGIQQSATANLASNRSNNLTRPIEYRQGGASDADYLVGELVIFDQVQHTADYTPGYTLPEQPYAEVPIELPTFVYQGEGLIQIFESIGQTATASSHWIINGKYFNGASWVISDNSYSQSNDLATVNAHIGSLQVSNSIIVTLVFSSGSTQAFCSNFAFTYTGQYYGDQKSITPNTAIPITAMTGFETEMIEPAGTSIKFQMEINAQFFWFNNAEWVSANNDAEANTLAEVVDGLSTLPIQATGDFVRPKVIFNSDGTGTSVIQSITMTVTYDINPVDKPPRTIIFGSLLDIVGFEMTNKAWLRVVNDDQFFIDLNSIQPGEVSKLANSEGVAAVAVVATASVDYKYSFYIDYIDANGAKKTKYLGKSIAPDDTASNIANLTFEA